MSMRFLAPLIVLTLTGVEAMAQTQVAAPRGDGKTAQLLVYEAKNGGACPATVLISRGLGTRQAGLRYLAENLQRHGYRVVIMRHVESDRALFQGRLVRQGRVRATPGAADPEQNRLRGLDLDAAWAFATTSCKPDFMVLAGHASGAVTTLVEAGAKPKFPAQGKDRFDAYVALSPQGVGSVYDAGAWANIRKPVLLITGTRDSGEGGSYRARQAAFDNMPAGRKRLAVIPNATHFALGGLGSRQVKSTVDRVTGEFLTQVRQKSWKPSAVSGVVVRDK